MSLQTARYYRGASATPSESDVNRFADKQDSAIGFTDPVTINRIIQVPQTQLSNDDMEQLKLFYKETITNLKIPHICHHCETKFSLWNNAGLRGCKAHTGRRIMGEWQCCKANTRDPRLPLFIQPSQKRYLSGSNNKRRKLDDDPFVMELVPSYEPISIIAGCHESDHRITGEEQSITPAQIDNMYEVLNQNQPRSVMFESLGRLSTPKKLAITSYIEIPYLVFIQMPKYQLRPVYKIVYKPTINPFINQQTIFDTNSLFKTTAVASINDLHPFPDDQDFLQVVVGDVQIDLVDTFVYISRMDARED